MLLAAFTGCQKAASLSPTARVLAAVNDEAITVGEFKKVMEQDSQNPPAPQDPEALILVRLLATLHDEEGTVAVPGLRRDVAAALDYSEERLRAESGLLDGVSLIGSGSLLSRLWTQPALTTIGINAPSVENASNTLVPAASAKVATATAAPEQDPKVAYAALKRHLEQHVAWGPG